MDIKFDKGNSKGVVLAHHQSRYGETVTDAKLAFDATRSGDFGNCTFHNCTITREEGASVRFYGCILVDCTFDPPFPPAGEGMGDWDHSFPGSLITTAPQIWSAAAVKSAPDEAIEQGNFED